MIAGVASYPAIPPASRSWCTAATASEPLTYVAKTHVSQSVAEKRESGIVVFTLLQSYRLESGGTRLFAR